VNRRRQTFQALPASRAPRHLSQTVTVLTTSAACILGMTANLALALALVSVR
jgi:hypothetical protein